MALAHSCGVGLPQVSYVIAGSSPAPVIATGAATVLLLPLSGGRWPIPSATFQEGGRGPHPSLQQSSPARQTAHPRRRRSQEPHPWLLTSSRVDLSSRAPPVRVATQAYLGLLRSFGRVCARPSRAVAMPSPPSLLAVRRSQIADGRCRWTPFPLTWPEGGGRATARPPPWPRAAADGYRRGVPGGCTVPGRVRPGTHHPGYPTGTPHPSHPGNRDPRGSLHPGSRDPGVRWVDGMSQGGPAGHNLSNRASRDALQAVSGETATQPMLSSLGFWPLLKKAIVAVGGSSRPFLRKRPIGVRTAPDTHCSSMVSGRSARNGQPDVPVRRQDGTFPPSREICTEHGVIHPVFCSDLTVLQECTFGFPH